MSGKDKTEVLTATFQSVFTTDDDNNFKFDYLHSVVNTESFEITAQDISAALTKTSCKVSQTLDGIPVYFLKHVAPSITVVLCYLFNLSLNSSKLPYQWKQAVVIPIYKKGCRNVPTNYHPISLTCVMCRLFEAIIAEKVPIYLLGNELIATNQHSFIPHKSTHTQLISNLNK